MQRTPYVFIKMTWTQDLMEHRLEMISIRDYINFLKKKTLIVGYLNLVAASVSVCLLTACASVERNESDQPKKDDEFYGESYRPLWIQFDREVTFVVIAVIDAGQAVVSLILVIAAHREWALLVTPWLLHSALWLPAQGAAALAVAPPGLSPSAAFATLAFFVAGLLLWLRAFGAVRDFQRLMCTQLADASCSIHQGA